MGKPQFEQTAVLSGPITVAPQSFTTVGTLVSGNGIGAGTDLFGAPFTAPGTGSIVIWGSFTGTNAVLQYQVGSGPWQALNGPAGALVAGEAWAFSIPVLAGDVVTFSTNVNTTSGGIEAAFSQKQ